MDTTRHTTGRSIVLVLALLVAMVSAGCKLFGGDAVEATSLSDASGEASGQAEEAPAAANPSDGETGEASDDVDLGDITDPSESDDPEDPSDDVALGEITDPSESDDPEDPSDDVAPDSPTPSEVRRVRTDIQTLFKQGELQLADDRATAVLEKEGLDPDFRLELEAYRDLARAAGTGDEVAAGDAMDRLQHFEPAFVDELALHPVLPEGVGPSVELDQAGAGVATENPPAEDTADGTADERAAQLDAVAKALEAENWKLADRLAEDVLANGKLTSEDLARARAYEQLAEAHARADADAVARATRSLAALDPDLARRLAPRSVTVDAEPAARSDG